MTQQPEQPQHPVLPEQPVQPVQPVRPVEPVQRAQVTPQAPTEIPAGWYPDPEGKPQSRYWDGDGWTDQLGPAVMTSTQAAAQAAPSLAAAFSPVATDAYGLPVSDRSRLAAALLCFFVGVLGVHRFYVGKVGTGILQLLTVGGFGIWALVDLILIVVGTFRDKQERLLLNW